MISELFTSLLGLSGLMPVLNHESNIFSMAFYTLGSSMWNKKMQDSFGCHTTAGNIENVRTKTVMLLNYIVETLKSDEVWTR